MADDRLERFLSVLSVEDLKLLFVHVRDGWTHIDQPDGEARGDALAALSNEYAERTNRDIRDDVEQPKPISEFDLAKVERELTKDLR